MLFPPNSVDREIHDLIESGMEYMYSIKKDYVKARKNFKEAHEMWKRETSAPLKPEIKLFFYLSIASSYDQEGLK